MRTDHGGVAAAIEPSASTIPCRLPFPSAWKERGEHCSLQLVTGKVVGPCRKRRHQTPTRQSPSRASPLFGEKCQGTHLVSCRRLARGNQAHRPLHVVSFLLERHTINCPSSHAGREKQGSKPPCLKRRHLAAARQCPSETCTQQLFTVRRHRVGTCRKRRHLAPTRQSPSEVSP